MRRPLGITLSRLPGERVELPVGQREDGVEEAHAHRLTQTSGARTRFPRSQMPRPRRSS
jgi:hypothetical protein